MTGQEQDREALTDGDRMALQHAVMSAGLQRVFDGLVAERVRQAKQEVVRDVGAAVRAMLRSGVGRHIEVVPASTVREVIDAALARHAGTEL